MMMQANNDRPSRPSTAQLSVAHGPTIDVLSQEVEEMELAEQRQVQHTAALLLRAENFHQLPL